MRNRIKFLLASLASTTVLALSGGVALAEGATTTGTGADIQNSLCEGGDTLNVSEQPSSNACDTANTAGASKFNDTLHTIINVFSIIVGIVAVIMIIIGGFRYITSGGNSEKVTSAKNTLIYAIVGLIIVALAQIIVRFVLSRSATP